MSKSDTRIVMTNEQIAALRMIYQCCTGKDPMSLAAPDIITVFEEALGAGPSASMQ